MSTIVAGAEVQVNTYTTGAQTSGQVTMLDGGGWVVTWWSDTQDGSGLGIYQQAYGADGTPTSGEIQVNTYTTGDQSVPQIAGLAGGGWVVTWESTQRDGTLYSDVYQQAYDAHGVPQGGETRVNDFTTNQQLGSQIVALEGGGWVVTWTSQNQDGSDLGLYQKAYAPDGAAGTETRVNTFTTNAQQSQEIVALEGGGWVVVWQSATGDGSSNAVFQQAYTANGIPDGGEIQVNTFTGEYSVSANSYRTRRWRLGRRMGFISARRQQLGCLPAGL